MSYKNVRYYTGASADAEHVFQVPVPYEIPGAIERV